MRSTVESLHHTFRFQQDTCPGPLGLREIRLVMNSKDAAPSSNHPFTDNIDL